MIAVPAAIACIEGRRLDQAREWLAQATRSAATWQGTAWQGAVTEARAHLARAEETRPPPGASSRMRRSCSRSPDNRWTRNGASRPATPDGITVRVRRPGTGGGAPTWWRG
jgi:hypothetical protein